VSGGRGALFLCAALLLPILGVMTMASGRAAEPERLAGAEKLRPFFQAMAALEKHRTRGPIRILQVGDSHTANDSFSGQMRERLQSRFGAAGRGWLPAGVPYKYFQPRLVSVTESGWRHLRPSTPGEKPPLGLDAVVSKATEADARMSLGSSEADGFDRVAIEFVARPGGEPLTIQVDENPPVRIATAAPKVGVRRSEVLLPKPAHQLQLVAPGAPVLELLGWAVERRRSGIIYENHGSIGATVRLLEKLDPAAVSFELADRKPALIAIAFGTNEGFRDDIDLTDYAARYRAAVSALAKRARGAAILVLGPPDGNRRPAECSGDAGCNASAQANGDSCAWTVPPRLAEIRTVQRRAALRQGWAFWDWSAAMGGACGMHRGLAEVAALAMPDHVHLSKTGYALTADRLFADLMRAYDDWKRAPRRH